MEGEAGGGDGFEQSSIRPQKSLFAGKKLAMKKSGSSHDLSKGLHRKLIIQNQGRSRGDRLSIPASSSKQQQIIIKLTKQQKSIQQETFESKPQKQPLRLSQSIATIVPPPELPTGTDNNAFLRRKLAERLNHFNY